MTRDSAIWIRGLSVAERGSPTSALLRLSQEVSTQSIRQSLCNTPQNVDQHVVI